MGAAVGGYAVTWATVSLLMMVMPLSRSDALVGSVLAAWLIYTLVILWCFSVKRKPMSFRQAMTGLHSWGGLVFGWLGFAIFLTGILAVFDDEITLWANPAVAAARIDPDQALILMTQADRKSPGSWFAMLPTSRVPAMKLNWREGQADVPIQKLIDTATGAELAMSQTAGGAFFTKFHYTLHAGDIGLWIVAATSVAMLSFIVSGVVIHRRIFKDFFTFRPRAASQRKLMDLHNFTAVLTLPFLIMIVYTGLTIKSSTYLPIKAASAKPGSSSPVGMPKPPVETALQHPPSGPSPSVTDLIRIAESAIGTGKIAFISVATDDDGRISFTASRRSDDRLNLSTDTVRLDRATGEILKVQRVQSGAYLTQRVFAGLHFGQYGGDLVRWIYFLCGAAGTCMIGAGLMLFSVKRRADLMRKPGLRHAETVTTAAVTGLCLACLAYLAGARILAGADAAYRSLETIIFFGTWAAALAHAIVRTPVQAWREQLTLSAAIAALLLCYDLGSALSISTLQNHLSSAAVLGTNIGLGLCAAAFAYAARHVRPAAPLRRRSAA